MSMFIAKVHVLSDGPNHCFISLGEEGRNSDTCMNRNDIAGRSIDIGWDVCLGNTSVQILRAPQGFMSETRHALESFRDRIHHREHVQRHHQLGKSEGAKQMSSSKPNEVATSAKRFRLGYWFFCCPGSEKTWKYQEQRPSHLSADGESDKLALRLTSEFITSKHPVFKSLKSLQTGAL